MADSMDMKSLAGMAASTQKPNRGDPSQKGVKPAKSSGRGGSFNGLLRSFMNGDESVSKAGRRTGPGLSGSKTAGAAGRGDTSNSGETDASNSGAPEKSQNEKPSRHCREARKAVEEELVEAALEAADLIWSLLYPDLATANHLVDDPPRAPAFSIIANSLGVADAGASPSGMEAGELDGNAMLAALETANVSAEMNIAAVKSAIEELLNGVPRSAVDSALAAKASEMGMPEPEGGFLRMAEELGLTEASYEEAEGGERPDALLARLEKTAGEAMRQNVAADAAEISGTDWDETEIYGLFARFLKENPQKISSSPISPADAEHVLQSFADWLAVNPFRTEPMAASGLGDELARIARLASTAAEQAVDVSETGTGPDVFTAIKTSLESALLPDSSRKMASAFLAVIAGQLSKDGENALQAHIGDNAKTDLKAMVADTAMPAMNAGMVGGGPEGKGQGGTSSMLERIENIEKLGEALRMRNSGGVKNLTLQLSPPELGKVSIRVEARDGIVSALLRVEKADAAAQLADNLRHLRESLKAQGIELGEIEVRQQPGAQTTHDGGGRRRQPESGGEGEPSEGGRYSAGDGEEADAATPTHRRMAGDPLNVYA